MNAEVPQVSLRNLVTMVTSCFLDHSSINFFSKQPHGQSPSFCPNCTSVFSPWSCWGFAKSFNSTSSLMLRPYASRFSLLSFYCKEPKEVMQHLKSFCLDISPATYSSHSLLLSSTESQDTAKSSAKFFASAQQWQPLFPLPCSSLPSKMSSPPTFLLTLWSWPLMKSLKF